MPKGTMPWESDMSVLIPIMKVLYITKVVLLKVNTLACRITLLEA